MKKFLLKMAARTTVLTEEDRDAILNKIIKENKKLVKRNKLIQYNLKMKGIDIKTAMKETLEKAFEIAGDDKELKLTNIVEYTKLAKYVMSEIIDTFSIRQGVSMYNDLSIENKIAMDNIMFDIQEKMCNTAKDGLNDYFTLKFVDNYEVMMLLRTVDSKDDAKVSTELTFNLNEELQQFIMNGIITRSRYHVPTFLIALKFCDEDFTEN